MSIETICAAYGLGKFSIIVEPLWRPNYVYVSTLLEPNTNPQFLFFSSAFSTLNPQLSANLPSTMLRAPVDVPSYRTFNVLLFFVVAATGGLLFGYDIGSTSYAAKQ